MWFLFGVIVAHFLSDFCLQTHWQASNKSHNMVALTRHVTTYSLSMTVLVGLLTLIYPGYKIDSVAVWWWMLFVFFAMTWLMHFSVDVITSKTTSRLWKKEDWHNFFVVVGFDQVLHYFTLFTTLYLLGVIA